MYNGNDPMVEELMAMFDSAEYANFRYLNRIDDLETLLVDVQRRLSIIAEHNPELAKDLHDEMIKRMKILKIIK